MARLYADVAGTFLVHVTEPADTLAQIERLGVTAVRRDIVMDGRAGRARLAHEALEALR
jgi:hypothetical protein